MSATVKTYVCTGASTGSWADSSDHLRFKNADNNTDNTSDPIQILASGVNPSYKKTISLYVTVAPATSISNVKLYSDGSSGLGTGVDIEYKAIANDGYSQATSNADNNGTASVFTLTSGSPLSLTGSVGAETGRGTLQAVELQMMVDDTASAGDTHANAETLTWQYDEA